jgi:hypothetical protein
MMKCGGKLHVEATAGRKDGRIVAPVSRAHSSSIEKIIRSTETNKHNTGDNYHHT